MKQKTVGYIVVGCHGAMAESKRSGPGLHFAACDDTVATVFSSRRDAEKAIEETKTRQAKRFPYEDPGWMRMKTIRLVTPGASR